jgi:hypothetical protein
MKPVLSVGLFVAVAVTAGAAESRAAQYGPKNLAAPTYRTSPAKAAIPHALTGSEVKHLSAIAESAADHLTVARYYSAQADLLDAKAAGYQNAAATYRRSPDAKNLMAPTTPARYEYLARQFRDEAASNRARAASHERMAQATAQVGK